MPSKQAIPDSPSPTDLRALYFLLRENFWLFLAITAVALAAGALFFLRSEKIYAATTTIEVEAEQQKLLKRDAGRPDERSVEIVLKTIEQNLKNSALLLRLARHPELTADPAFLREVRPSDSEARVQEVLAGKISVAIRRDTNLIDLTAADASPTLARNISRLLVEEFVRSTSEDRLMVSRDAHQFLREEANRLAAVLAKSEHALQQYKEQQRAVSLDQSQNIVSERLKEMNLNVTVAKAQRLKLEADRAELEHLAGQPPERLLAVPSISSNADVVDALRRITEKEAEIGVLSQRYKEEHPKAIAAASALRDLKARRDLAVLKAADLVGTGLTAAGATEKKLDEALRDQETTALGLSQMAIPYAALAREVESDRALYDSLLARLKEADVAQGVSQYAIRVVAPALLPHRPIKPNKRVILLLSLGVGFAVSLVCMLGRNLFDNSIRTVDDAERILRLPSVGAIPLQRRAKLKQAPLLLIESPQSATAEAVRSLRTTLLSTQRDNPCRATLFASAVPGEGKSFCAINYAVALARQGLRTLIIDADFRLPTVGPVFLAEEDPPGMGELLQGLCGFDEAVHPANVENLSVLPAGARVFDPSELVGQANLSGLIQKARACFDRVVIDTAPVLAVSETILFVPHVDAVCLVVRAGSTPASAVSRALKQLTASGARVAGFILNGLPARSGGYHYHYHAPGYGHDEVYGASTPQSERWFRLRNFLLNFLP